MNRLKIFFKYIGIFIILLILFRGFLYRSGVNYSPIDVRNNIPLIDKNLIMEINEQVKGEALKIDEITSLSNKITSKKLNFTFNRVSSNPNKITQLKKANCIRYSSLFNSIGNYLIIKQNLTDEYEFKHLVGKLDIFGFDIHNLLNNPFFQDHDFNEIRNKKTDEKYFVDPSLRDYLRIDYVKSE